MLSWAFVCTILFEHLFSVLLGIYLPRSGSIGSPGAPRLPCRGNVTLLSGTAAALCVPTRDVGRSHFLHIFLNTLFPGLFFKNYHYAILVGGKWHLPVALTGVSHVTSDAEHLSNCLLVICAFPREKLLAESLVPGGWDSILQIAGGSSPWERRSRI